MWLTMHVERRSIFEKKYCKTSGENANINHFVKNMSFLSQLELTVEIKYILYHFI